MTSPQEQNTGRSNDLSITLLMVTREERKTHVLDGLELGVVLVVRIAKVLNLSHRELTNTKKTSTRRNLISETSTDLRPSLPPPSTYLSSSKRELVTVVVQQSLKVHKHTLSSLRTKVTLHITSSP